MVRELEANERKKLIYVYLDELVYSIVGLGLGILGLSLRIDPDSRRGLRVIMGAWLLIIIGIGFAVVVMIKILRVKKAKCIPKVNVLSLTRVQQSKEVIAQIQFINQGETQTHQASVLRKAVPRVQETGVGKLYYDDKYVYLDSID